MSNKIFFKEFVKELLNINSPSQMEDFLRGILTDKELVEIPTRLKIIKLLKTGTPQKEIAEKLGVGIATVTRGSKELQKGRFNSV